MNFWNRLFIILGIVMVLMGISYSILPWFEGDYLATVVIVGFTLLFWGIFNSIQIALWKKILFLVLSTIVSSAVLIFLIILISSLIAGTLSSSINFFGMS